MLTSERYKALVLLASTWFFISQPSQQSLNPHYPTHFPIFSIKMMSPLSLKAVGAAAAVYMLGQQVQCPQIAIPLIADAVAMTVAQVGSAAASFGGAIAAGHFAGGARDVWLVQGRDTQVTAPAGVPQYNFDMCVESLSDPAVSVTVSGPVENNGKLIF